ncbi:MAG TPA: hypothetical protein PLD37_08220 [Usitatibacteraceae bacterium]|nr:hypothetical protein [Usitatibacteraceae bacterium]
MKDTDRYLKVVAWSEEDQCYVGTSPGLVLGGVHGTDERAVFDELCRVVDEAVAIYRAEGRPLPAPTTGTVPVGPVPAS